MTTVSDICSTLALYLSNTYYVIILKYWPSWSLFFDKARLLSPFNNIHSNYMTSWSSIPWRCVTWSPKYRSSSSLTEVAVYVEDSFIVLRRGSGIFSTKVLSTTWPCISNQTWGSFKFPLSYTPYILLACTLVLTIKP